MFVAEDNIEFDVEVVDASSTSTFAWSLRKNLVGRAFVSTDSMALFTSACIVPRMLSIKSRFTAPGPSHFTISNVISFATARTFASLASKSGASPFKIIFGGTTLGVPNVCTAINTAFAAASATFGTLCIVTFSNISKTASACSSSINNMQHSVERSTAFGRPLKPFAATLARISPACLPAYSSSAIVKKALVASNPASSAAALPSEHALCAALPACTKTSQLSVGCNLPFITPLRAFNVISDAQTPLEIYVPNSPSERSSEIDDECAQVADTSSYASTLAFQCACARRSGILSARAARRMSESSLDILFERISTARARRYRCGASKCAVRRWTLELRVGEQLSARRVVTN